jgi:signal peptidase II
VLIIAVAILAADQLSKWLLLAQVMQPPRVIELTGFLNLVLVYNSGVSFGLFGGGGAWTVWFFSGLAAVIVVGLFIWMRRQQGRLPGIAVGLICGGAVGNVIDRLLHGAVVDFIDLHAGGWHWPAFNVADSAISVGVALLILHSLFFDRGESK